MKVRKSLNFPISKKTSGNNLAATIIHYDSVDTNNHSHEVIGKLSLFLIFQSEED